MIQLGTCKRLQVNKNWTFLLSTPRTGLGLLESGTPYSTFENLRVQEHGLVSSTVLTQGKDLECSSCDWGKGCSIFRDETHPGGQSSLQTPKHKKTSSTWKGPVRDTWCLGFQGRVHKYPSGP